MNTERKRERLKVSLDSPSFNAERTSVEAECRAGARPDKIVVTSDSANAKAATRQSMTRRVAYTAETSKYVTNTPSVARNTHIPAIQATIATTKLSVSN